MIEASLSPFDLLVHAGRVVCTATGLDGPGSIAIVGDRIAAAGPGVDGAAREVLRLPDAIVLPGLVDLHAHPGRASRATAWIPTFSSCPTGPRPCSPRGKPAP